VANAFCHFWILREMPCNQGQHFKSWLLQEVLWCFRCTRWELLSIKKNHIKTTEKHLTRWTSETDTRGYHSSCWPIEYSCTRPKIQCLVASVVFGKELCLLGNLMFGAPQTRSNLQLTNCLQCSCIVTA
jgi:hypothetical protein